ncbi:MAG: glutamine amidotransferase [Hyphomicrobiales bacterium]|nr:glutamine amidotransferase [Hyphomicrobiales bacterium]
MSKRALALRHVAFEDVGVWSSVLAERGYDLHYVDVGPRPLPLDAIAGCDLMIVLGAPIGVYETDAYPFLIEEIAAIGARLAARRPTLGVCLGAQLMAAALGARVAPGPGKEIGYAPVELTPEGLGSPLAAMAASSVLHWHGDNFDLPAGAERLGATKLCPNQAFRIGNHALGLQFHVEADPDALESWLIGHACELAAAKIDPRTLRAEARRHGAATADAGRRVLSKWIEGLTQ